MGRIRGILLVGLSGFELGLILCRLYDLSPLFSLIFALAGFLGAVAGAISTGRSDRGSLGIMAVGVLLGGGLGAISLPGYFLPVLNLGACLLGLGALVASGYGFYGPLGVWGTLISGTAMLVAGHWGKPWQMIALGAMLVILLFTLDGFRDTSMRKSQHKNRSFSHIGNPGNIRKHSFVLLALFLALALGLSLICWGMQSLFVGILRSIFTRGNWVYDAFIQWIEPIMEAFVLWLRSRLNQDSGSGGGGDSEIIDTGFKRMPYAGSALATGLLIAAFVVLCGAVALGVGGLMIHRRLKKREEREPEDFEDFVEKLEHPSLFRRLKKRKDKSRLRDYETPAMKIRFVFQQLLRKKQKSGSVICKTPNELLDVSVTDEDVLIRAYNQVKYGHGQISEEDLAAVERYYQRQRFE